MTRQKKQISLTRFESSIEKNAHLYRPISKKKILQIKSTIDAINNTKRTSNKSTKSWRKAYQRAIKKYDKVLKNLAHE